MIFCGFSKKALQNTHARKRFGLEAKKKVMKLKMFRSRNGSHKQ